MGQFSQFLLLEQQSILFNRIAPIVQSMDSLSQDMEQMGTRHILRNVTETVGQIRRILKDNWSDHEQPILVVLQKVAFNLIDASQNKGDLKTTVQEVTKELHNLSSQSKMQLNNLENQPSK